MQENSETEQSLDLSKFWNDESLWQSKSEFNLSKNPNGENYFEPIANEFYGFSIPILEKCRSITDAIDIEYEDLTNQKLLENGK